MMGLAMKAMGIDPGALMGQAGEFVAAFQTMRAQLGELLAGQARADEALLRIEANQGAVMAALGLAVPLPAGDVLRLIEDGTARHLAAASSS